MTRLSLDFFKTFLVVFEARAEVSSAGASFSSSHIILLLTFEATLELKLAQLEPILKAEARAEVSSARAYFYFKL
jgi:hypothetical protein